MLGVGVWVAPTVLPVGPVLISLGGLVLLLGFALPLIAQVDLGLPSVFKVSLAASERRDRLHSSVEDCRGLLVACATCLCVDQDSALRAVEASVSETLASWHGNDREALRRFLLCNLVHQSRFEAKSHSPIQFDAPTHFFRLPLIQREVLILIERAGLDEHCVADMLGESDDEILRIRAVALASLGPE